MFHLKVNCKRPDLTFGLKNFKSLFKSHPTLVNLYLRKWYYIDCISKVNIKISQRKVELEFPVAYTIVLSWSEKFSKLSIIYSSSFIILHLQNLSYFIHILHRAILCYFTCPYCFSRKEGCVRKQKLGF